METVFVFSRRVVELRSNTPARLRAVVAMTAAAVFVAGGCSRGESTQAGKPAAGTPTVVASTDVWGSVAQAVAGDDAPVSSIIKSGSADPHSFEPSPVNAAQLADASIVVYNGGGYDPWVDAVLKNHPDVPSVNAYSLRNAAGEPQPANEHVFYDVGTAVAVAADLATKLAAADPDKADHYGSRAQEFARRADTVRAAEDRLRAAHPGAAVVATEPVAHYLLSAIGLTDKTPPGFTAAVEQDTDPAPADMAAVLDLITSRSVAAVIFNDQTVTAATRQVRAAAEKAGGPIVSVTETLPAGVDYLTWQTDTVKTLADALKGSR